MPQCKKGYCREPAIIGGKRYCKEHMAQYLARRKEYQDRSRDWPECESCLSEYNPEANEGPRCRSCEEAHQERLTELEGEQRKRLELDQCQTVEELRGWIRDYLL